MHRRFASSGSWLCLVALVVVSAASCSKKNPAGPDQTEPPVAQLPSPQGLTLTLLSAGAGPNTVRITWASVDRATGYVVEAGTTPGTSTDLLLIETTAPSYDWVGAPSGLAYVSVKSRNATQTSLASAERTIAVLDFRDYVEAIFLGSGPLADNDHTNHGCSRTVYSRFKIGSVIKIRISTSIPNADITATTAELASVKSLAHGLDFNVETTTEPDPIPADGEVTMAAVPQADVTRLCLGAAGGCAINAFPAAAPTGLLRGIRVIVAQGSPSNYYFHEAGHGVFGLCHAVVGDYQTLMTSGAQLQAPHFSDLDRMAIDAVFGAGMEPGATRADFAAKGLVRP